MRKSALPATGRAVSGKDAQDESGTGKDPCKGKSGHRAAERQQAGADGRRGDVHLSAGKRGQLHPANGGKQPAAEPRQRAAAGCRGCGALCRRCSRTGTGGLPLSAQRPARAAQRHPAGFCPAVFARGGNGAVRPGAVGSPPAHPAGDDARCHAGAGLPRRAVPAAHPALCRAGVPCREQRRSAPRNETIEQVCAYLAANYRQSSPLPRWRRGSTFPPTISAACSGG